MKEKLLVAVAAAASWGHAIWSTSAAGVGTPAEAGGYAAALRAANALAAADVGALMPVATELSGPLSLWTGLWLAIVGKTSTVAVASLLPFHGLAADGLWRGGKAAGGPLGGALAPIAGLGAAGALAGGAETTAGFPLFACVALVAGAALERGWKRVGIGTLAGVAFGGGALVAGAGTLGGGAAGAAGVVATTLFDVAGPALLVGVIGALLLRGDAVTLGLLAGAGALYGATYALGADPLAVVPILAIAAAGIGRTPAAALGLGALAVAQIVGFHTDREGWPGRPAALRSVAADTPDLDPVLDWLVARLPAVATGAGDAATTAAATHAAEPPAAGPSEPARVALAVTESPGRHAGLFEVRALERGDPLTFTVVTDGSPLTTMTDLGVVVTRPNTPSPRDGWRAQLPPPTETLAWPDGHRVSLWDRGLPPETLLASPEEAEARNHPFRQSLWAYVDGAEVGPLLDNASSAEIVVTGERREVVFVRNQALWRAQAGLGTRYEAERPLLDAAGNELHAFDPAVVTLPDGTLRLYAAELVGDERGLDPAHHPTRVVSWRGPSLDALVREPGVRLEGVGIVDPAVVRDGDSWRMYVTVERSRVAMATSEDGLAFGPLAHVTHGTVPAPTPFGLVVQRQVMGWSVLYVVPDPVNPDPANPDAPRATSAAASSGATSDAVERSLELCATGATFADRLYYTRAAEPCPEPVVLASRRKAVLDPLLAVAP